MNIIISKLKLSDGFGELGIKLHLSFCKRNLLN